MSNFSGKYYYSVDPKGRVMIPAPLREIISANYSDKLYVTIAPADKCIQIYPQEEWSALMERVRGLAQSNKAVKRFRRTVIGSAVEVTMDKQGRLQVPVSLREDTGIKSEIVVVGQLDKIEVWDRAEWDKSMGSTGEDDSYEAELGALGI